MSANIEQFSDALLNTLGGEPCTDLDGDRPGVWLPVAAWEVLVDCVIGAATTGIASPLKN